VTYTVRRNQSRVMHLRVNLRMCFHATWTPPSLRRQCITWYAGEALVKSKFPPLLQTKAPQFRTSEAAAGETSEGPKLSVPNVCFYPPAINIARNINLGSFPDPPLKISGSLGPSGIGTSDTESKWYSPMVLSGTFRISPHIVPGLSHDIYFPPGERLYRHKAMQRQTSISQTRRPGDSGRAEGTRRWQGTRQVK
jgi:hypothetical protein